MSKPYIYKSVRAAFEERFGKLTKGQSEDEIAEQIGIYPLEVRRWIYGELPYVRQLPQIADAYGVTTDYLLGRTEEKEPAQATAGQAPQTRINTHSIAQTSEVVNNFTYFPPILLEFARQYFGDIEAQRIFAFDDITAPDNLKRAEIEFTDCTGNRYLIRVDGIKEEEP